MKKTKEEGLSLRMAFLLMLLISVCITSILLFTTYRAIQSFRALSDATNTYIDLQEAADNLLKASDFLTEEAQCYAVMGERVHLDNYFYEAETTCRRDHAIEVMEKRLPESEALTSLKDAMNASVALMDREYYAMKLMLLAQGDGDIPAAIASVSISEADLALSAEEKKALSAKLMHDADYYRQKNTVRSHLGTCIETLKRATRGTQNDMEENMRENLIWMVVMIIMQSLTLVVLLGLTTSLGINPILRAVDNIKQDQKLPITGAHEFRYLAETYNKMYVAYKRSIDHLSYKASHDELTGIYNRAGYDLIKRSVDLSTTAFLLVDADRFKNVNDQNGHEVGDRVLQKIANALKKNFRSDDYIFRIGGDEFMVLMVHVNQEIKPLIERKVIQINRDLSDPRDDLPPVSVSVGVSLCGGQPDPNAAFHEADIALYYVKDHGRNGCCFYNHGMRNKLLHHSNVQK